SWIRKAAGLSTCAAGVRVGRLRRGDGAAEVEFERVVAAGDDLGLQPRVEAVVPRHDVAQLFDDFLRIVRVPDRLARRLLAPDRDDVGTWDGPVDAGHFEGPIADDAADDGLALARRERDHAARQGLSVEGDLARDRFAGQAIAAPASRKREC